MKKHTRQLHYTMNMIVVHFIVSADSVSATLTGLYYTLHIHGKHPSDQKTSNQRKFLLYGAMHYSAKRGLAIACRPSVCLPVCNKEHLQ